MARRKEPKISDMARCMARGYLISEFRTFPEFTDEVLEAVVLECGRAGANADVNHPLRLRWEAARWVLDERKAKGA